MASQGTGYDLSASTYSPDGRIFQVRTAPPVKWLYFFWLLNCISFFSPQIEYAQKATENAGTVIGIKCSDGILLAVEKLVQTKLLVPGSNKRIFTVDYHAGVASAGLIADGKHLAIRARDEAISFRDTYRYKAPVKVSKIDTCIIHNDSSSSYLSCSHWQID